MANFRYFGLENVDDGGSGEPIDTTNLVTLDGAQAIAGVKNFTSTPTLNGFDMVALESNGYINPGNISNLFFRDAESTRRYFLAMTEQPTIMPNMWNTGPRITLTDWVGNYTLTKDFEVISGLKILGDVITNGFKHGMMIDCQVANGGVVQTTNRFSDFFIAWCEVGDFSYGGSAGLVNKEAGISDGGFTVFASKIHGYGDGIKGGWGNSYVFYSYIWDLNRYNTSSGYIHCDCIQNSGGVESNNFGIIANTLVGISRGAGGNSVSSCIMHKADFGAMDNTDIKYNDLYTTSATKPINTVFGSKTTGTAPNEVTTVYPSPTNVRVWGNTLQRHTVLNDPWNTDDTSFYKGNRWREADGAVGSLIEPVPNVTGNSLRCHNLGGGNGATTPWVAGRISTTKLTLVADICPDNWIFGTTQHIMSQADLNTGQPNSIRSFRFSIPANSGLINLGWYPNTAGGLVSASCQIPFLPPNYAVRGRYCVAITLDYTGSGTGNYVLYFYAGPTIDTMKLFNVRRDGVGVTAVNDGASPLEVGARNVGGIDRFQGRIFETRLIDGDLATGTIKARFNPQARTDIVTQKLPASITEPTTGEVWTLGGGAKWAGPIDKAISQTGIAAQNPTENIVNPLTFQKFQSAVNANLVKPTTTAIATNFFVPHTSSAVEVTTGASAFTGYTPPLIDGLEFSIVHPEATGSIQMKDFTTNVNVGPLISGAGRVVTFRCNGADWKVKADNLVQVAETLPATLIDAKGDLIIGSADNTAVRLGVGANKWIPMADSASANGIKWVPLSSVSNFIPFDPSSGEYITTAASSTGSAAGYAADVMYLEAIDIPNAKAFDRLLTEITALGVGADLVIRMGLYADNGTFNKPTGAPLLDAGTVDPTVTTGQKSLTINWTPSTPGRYWGAWVLQGTVSTSPTVVTLSGVNQIGLSSTGNLSGRTWAQYGVTGALPTIGAISRIANIPMLALRAS